jgi:hypothetical protein
MTESTGHKLPAVTALVSVPDVPPKTNPPAPVKPNKQSYVDEYGNTPQKVADDANHAFRMLSPTTQSIMTQFELTIRKLHPNRAMNDELTSEKDVLRPGGSMRFFSGCRVGNSADYVKECRFTAVQKVELDNIGKFLLGVAREHFLYLGIDVIINVTAHSYTVLDGIIPSQYCNIEVLIINKSVIITYIKKTEVTDKDYPVYSNPADRPHVVTSSPVKLATLLNQNSTKK